MLGINIVLMGRGAMEDKRRGKVSFVLNDVAGKYVCGIAFVERFVPYANIPDAID